MTQEEQKEILKKLYTFYNSRYEKNNLETKFNEVVYELVKSNDIKIVIYVEFCIDNDIEPKIKDINSNDISTDLDLGWEQQVILTTNEQSFDLDNFF